MKGEFVERLSSFTCELCGDFWEPQNEIGFVDSTTAYIRPNGNIYCSEICATKDENILKVDCHEN